MFETILEPNDLLILRNAVSIAGITTEEFEILPLIKRCSSIRINGYALGSCKSRYSASSVVMISPLDPSVATPSLAEIQYFFCCDISYGGVVKPHYFVQHPAKVWFGSPTQVWAVVTTSETHFLPVSCIRSRVAYSMRRYDFGRLIGESYPIVNISSVIKRHDLIVELDNTRLSIYTMYVYVLYTCIIYYYTLGTLYILYSPILYMNYT